MKFNILMHKVSNSYEFLQETLSRLEKSKSISYAIISTVTIVLSIIRQTNNVVNNIQSNTMKNVQKYIAVLNH